MNRSFQLGDQLRADTSAHATVEKAVGRDAAFVVLALVAVAVAVAVWRVRKHRAERRAVASNGNRPG